MVRYCEAYWNDVDKVLKCVPNLEKLKGKSVFITGSTGMICSSVVDLLFRMNQQKNMGVMIFLGGRSLERTCNRFVGYQNGKDFSFVSYDATSRQTLVVDADYIIHGASNANPAIFISEPVETILANINGLDQLLEMAYKRRGGRLLYISSSEVYGNVEKARPYREEDYGFLDILNPRAAYPCSKRTAETLCVSYALEYGIDTVIVRPGHIYGPSITDTDSRASAQFTRNAAKGKNIVMKSAGQQLRSYCYTLDCASAILTVLINGKSENAYNISNRNSIVTILDIANAFAEAAGIQVAFETSSDLEKKSYNLMSNSSLNAEKLEKLGWHAIFGLKEGIKNTIAYYK